MDKGYPKLFFRDSTDRIVSAQIKSFTVAAAIERGDLIHKLFDGAYDVVQCIIPRDFFNTDKEKAE